MPLTIIDRFHPRLRREQQAAIEGIILTVLAPGLAAYTLFGTIGNVSGAAGDVWVTLKILPLSEHVLVEDTETGYRVWVMGEAIHRS